MSTFKIHPIVVGTKIFDKGMMTYQHDYGKAYTIPIYCWYLEGGGNKILVDTGELRPIISEDRETKIGGRIYSFEDGLAQFELKPEEIDIVIHTHLHNDHCENDYQCTNATFFVHRKELDRIHDPHPLDFRYNEEFIIDVEENNQLQILDEDHEIVPGIRVIHTPAHTEGGMSVEIVTMAGKAIITGFCVINENFHPPKEITAREMEVIPPGTHVNVYEAYDIMKKVKAQADIILPLHEPSFASLKTIP
jgi:N-acyl homoserine lactone hydrolase